MTEQSRCCGSFAESRAARSRLRFFEHLVHSGGFGFPGMLADVEHPDAQLARAEGDFDYVAHFDVVRRFDNPAVYGNMFVVAGSFETVRRFMSRDTLRNLSILMFMCKMRISTVYLEKGEKQYRLPPTPSYKS